MSLKMPPAGFVEIRDSGVCVWVREGFSFLFDPAGNMRKDRPVCTVVPGATFRGRAELKRISLGSAGPPCGLVRHYRRGGLMENLLKDCYLGRGRFRRELRVTEWARTSGVPTANVIALRTERAGMWVYRADLVTREIETALDLDAFMKAARNPGRPRGAGPWKARAVSLVASLVRTMHDAGLYHADLNMKNILLQGEGDMLRSYIIDLDKARVIMPLKGRRRLSNLTRLYRSLEKLGYAGGEISLRDMARFVKVYCWGDRRLEAACRKRIRRVPFSLRVHRFFWRLAGRGV
jgi:tRNA A-37 threonylcarbamoyl transferase component Bud32